jgi:hypothetical protein
MIKKGNSFFDHAFLIFKLLHNGAAQTKNVPIYTK